MEKKHSRCEGAFFSHSGEGGRVRNCGWKKTLVGMQKPRVYPSDMDKAGGRPESLAPTMYPQVHKNRITKYTSTEDLLKHISIIDPVLRNYASHESSFLFGLKSSMGATTPSRLARLPILDSHLAFGGDGWASQYRLLVF